MGATPTHQTETQMLDTELWTAEEGNQDALLVPFWGSSLVTQGNEGGMLGVEGGTIQTSCHEAKCVHRSLGSTVLASTPTSKGPWSCTTSMKEEDLYPAEHIFVSIELYPCDTSSLVIKSSMTVSNGIASGFGYIGCKGAFVGCILILFC